MKLNLSTIVLLVVVAGCAYAEHDSPTNPLITAASAADEKLSKVASIVQNTSGLIKDSAADVEDQVKDVTKSIEVNADQIETHTKRFLSKLTARIKEAMGQVKDIKEKFEI